MSLFYHTKPGRHGTLYLYSLDYRNDCDDLGAPTFSWHCYAYSTEHAVEKFYDGCDGEGWGIVSEPTRVRVRQSGQDAGPAIVDVRL